MLVAAGCGGSSPPASSATRGSDVFASACSGCHTLAGHDTPVQGGDLATTTLTVDEIESFVRVMPVRLTSGQVAAVAAYVHDAELRR